MDPNTNEPEENSHLQDAAAEENAPSDPRDEIVDEDEDLEDGDDEDEEEELEELPPSAETDKA